MEGRTYEEIDYHGNQSRKDAVEGSTYKETENPGNHHNRKYLAIGRKDL